ncbi:MAG: HAD-IA family hydrolase [Proteobacteria bacterium]|nr:HAD-IA family hydrolase [Pseudomonadota bacterium]
MVTVFDLGKVILDFDRRTITGRLARISRIPQRQVDDLIFRGGLEEMYDRGELSSRDFYRAVTGSLGIDIPFEAFKAIWTEIFAANEEVCEVVRTLSKHYRLLLLSNTNEMHFDYVLGVFEILRIFDDYVLSYKVGERKPHPKIYEAVLERAQCPAGDCVYIDDMEENVMAARRLGIQGIVYRNGDQLRRSLRAFRVDI